MPRVYPLNILPHPTTGYLVRAVDFPEVEVRAPTMVEAQLRGQIAVEVAVATYRREGRPIPTPSASNGQCTVNVELN